MVHGVHAENRLPPAKESVGDVVSDESGTTGDENWHE
jgi:hypothetical protein